MEDEIRELRRQLAAKERYIAQLEDERAKVENALRVVATDLVNDLPEDAQEQIAEVQRITRNGDIATRFLDVIDYVQSKARASVQRVAAQLRGHVNFLTRLAESPELQSLFLVSEYSGETFLSETTKRLMEEQAAKTSAFLAGLGNGTKATRGFSDISCVLDPSIDYNRREREISNFVDGGEATQDELGAMLLQEVLITSVLRRYIQKGGCSTNSRLQTTDDDGSWTAWARKLYYGLTRTNPQSVPATGLRMTIEEAALTTIGAQKLTRPRTARAEREY